MAAIINNKTRIFFLKKLFIAIFVKYEQLKKENNRERKEKKRKGKNI